MRNEEEQRALKLLREYGIFFFYNSGRNSLGRAHTRRGQRSEGQEASGTKFSRVLVEIK